MDSNQIEERIKERLKLAEWREPHEDDYLCHQAQVFLRSLISDGEQQNSADHSGNDDEWLDIDTAPKDGTVIIGCSLDPKRKFPPRRMKWGVAARPDENYVCNNGAAFWVNEDGRHLAPRPTHWRSAEKNS